MVSCNTCMEHRLHKNDINYVYVHKLCLCAFLCKRRSIYLLLQYISCRDIDEILQCEIILLSVTFYRLPNRGIHRRCPSTSKHVHQNCKASPSKRNSYWGGGGADTGYNCSGQKWGNLRNGQTSADHWGADARSPFIKQGCNIVLKQFCCTSI